MTCGSTMLGTLLLLCRRVRHSVLRRPGADLHESRLRHHRRARRSRGTILVFSGWRRNRVCVPGLARERKPASAKESPARITGATPSSEHEVRLLQPDMAGGGRVRARRLQTGVLGHRVPALHGRHFTRESLNSLIARETMRKGSRTT